MKLKNLNFAEQHIEKILIGVGVAFFGLVVWLFVVGEPYVVKVPGESEPLTPEQVEQVIRRKADLLETQTQKKTLPFDKIPLPNWTDDFRDRMTGHFLPVDRLPYPMSSPGLDQGLIVASAVVNPERTVPTPPQVTDLLASASFGVLALPEKGQEQQRQAIIKLIGDIKKPADFRYVSVSASFSMQKWRELLKAPGETPDKRIPEDWWRNRLFLTDVTLQRQELNPATGQWGEAITVVSPPPQTHQYRDFATKLTAGEVPALLEGVRASQDTIARPPFVPLAKGQWDAPGDIQEDQQGEATDQNQATKAVQTALHEPARPRPAVLPRAARRIAARGGAFAPQPSVNGGQPSVLLQLEDVKIWSHDLTVVPGKTYRYRFVVSVLSPLFHSNEVSREQYEAYFNKLSLSSEPSEWSQPVKVDPTMYFFLTAQDGSRQQATIDVFHIFDGRWIHQPFQVQAGDPIGDIVKLPYMEGTTQQTAEVNMDTGHLLVDILFPSTGTASITSADQTQIVVYDQATNSLAGRTLGQDLKDKTYERLQQAPPEIQSETPTAKP